MNLKGEAVVPPIPSIIALNPNSAIGGKRRYVGDPKRVLADQLRYRGLERQSSHRYLSGFCGRPSQCFGPHNPWLRRGYGCEPGRYRVSNAAPFQILYQPRAINQSTSDMVWDVFDGVVSFANVFGKPPALEIFV